MEDEIDLREYLIVIWKYKFLVLFVAFISVIISFVLSSRQPIIYKAEATIMPLGSSGGALSGALSSISILTGGGGSGGIDFDSILKSRALAKMVARDEDLDLIQVFDKQNALNKTWAALGQEEKILSIAQSIQGSIKAMPKNGLIVISFDWNEPKLSAKIVNKYIEKLAQFFNAKGITNNFDLIDEALVPGAPSKDTKKNLLVGFVIGLFVGIFLAFFIEYLSKINQKK